MQILTLASIVILVAGETALVMGQTLPPPPNRIPKETRRKDAPAPEKYEIPKEAKEKELPVRPDPAVTRAVGYFLVADKPKKGDDPVPDILVGLREYRGKQLVHETRYLADPASGKSSKHGIERRWHADGVISEELIYDQGLLDGKCKQWSSDGHLLGTYEMKLGKGVKKEWDDHGKLIRQTPLVENRADGKATTYRLNGMILEETYYRGGLLHGIAKRWDDNGRMTDGYPLFFINSKEITREKYTDARKLDPTLPAE